MGTARPAREGFAPVSGFGLNQRMKVAVNWHYAAQSVHQKRPSATHAVIAIVVWITRKAARQTLD
ncbi:MAG: hypothetical protein QOK03_2624, partial [Candidatus Binataceae bacterium]|nr:hypothetical protein [Candidatus Binataceae bacterium]